MEVRMNLEEAITTALEYETRIRDLYRDAVAGSADPVAQRVFGALGDDEQRHVVYLRRRLTQWRQSGAITVEALESVLPPAAAIRKAAGRISATLAEADRTDEKQMLAKALRVEKETSDFYARMVAQLPGAGREMFARFLEIENSHIDAVQFELDYISGTGYWFDFKEFDMEDG
jgi:rubrerythrin